MITLPPGQVTLPDRRTQRVWSVELAPYQLAALPITQAQYVDLTGQRPSAAEGDQASGRERVLVNAVRFCNARSERDGFAAPTICKPTAMASSGTPPLPAADRS
jgi:sulfatase modifying factor 1